MAQAKKSGAIIFDLDGTIADSIPTMLQIVHELVKGEYTKEDVSRLRGASSLKILHELKIPLWRAYFLLVKARKRMALYIDAIPIVPGMNNAIRHLSEKNALFVVSANSAANVQTYLQRFKLEDCFTQIYGGIAPWRKQHVLRRLTRDHVLDANSTWYVADEDLDIRAAHKAGLKAAAVSWGFSNIHVLEKQKPEALVFNSDELIAVFGADE